MRTFILLLVCTASIVSAGVWDIQRTLQGHGIQDEVNLNDMGTRRISQMTQEDLLRQKFLLDILQHVNGPLLNEELLQLSQSLVEDQQLYNGGIDEEMLHVIQLARGQRLLGKREVFSITNDDHLRQLIGLYRLMVRSRDWETLKRNIANLRAQVNGVLLVNSLLLAVRDRQDTQRLVMPAIHEILPELFHDEDLIRRVQNMDLNQLTSTSQTMNSQTETRRPGILEMIAVNRRANMDTNRVGLLDRTQLWMPWREMRMEMNSRRIGGMKTPAQVSIRNDDRIVVPVQQRQRLMGEESLMAMLTEDVGLKSFIHGLVNDLCLKEDEVLQNNMRQHMMTGGVGGRVGLERNIGSMLERERTDDMDRRNMGDVHGMSTNTEDEHLLHVGRRHWNDDSINRDNIMNGRVVVEQRQRLSDELLQQQQQGRRQMIDIESDVKRGLADELLPTTSIDDKRLLHINRRRLHAATVNEMALGRMHQLQDQISGNTPRRHFLNIMEDTGRIHEGRHVLDRDLNVEDQQRMRMGMNMDWNTDVNGGMMRNEMNILRNGAMDGRGMNRDTNMRSNQRMIDNRLRQYQQQQQQQGNLDDSLPTTAINDERLLHVGRRRLNEIQNNMGIHQDGIMNMNRRRWDDRDIYTNVGNQRMNMMRRENIYDARRVGDHSHIQDDDVVDRNRQHQIDAHRNNMDIDNEDASQNVRQVSGRGMEDIGIHDDRNIRLESLIHDRLREENMAQRRGAMHDNWNWNMNTNRRRIVDDDRDLVVDMNRDMWHRRSPRSIMRGIVMDRNQGIEQERSGELLLHNLQQLMARINMERISLGLPDILQITNQNIPQHVNNPRLAQDANERLALRLNDMRLDTRRNRLLLDRINDIERRLTSVIEQEIQNTVGGIHGHRLTDIDRKIGDVLLGKSVEGQTINVLNILREVLLQTEQLQRGQQTLAHVGVDLQDPILMHILRRIVRIADLQRQNVLGAYHREELQLNGVTVNEVTVDKLQTIVDINDVDLINLLDSRVRLGDRSQINRMVVARHQRLNHKSFTINMDITADRNQRVVIRTLLGPKVDGMGREVQLNEQRDNFMLLDAHVANLQTGRNSIKRKSRDITWTMRDTTPLSDIYRRVMMAINGHLDVTLDQVQGQNCQFPHRLILPRGRTDGLPMQLLVIATPLDETSHINQNVAVDNTICGIGMGSLNLDRLPLGFPLDRPIDDIQQLLAVSNLHLIDVKIHHDDQLRTQEL